MGWAAAADSIEYDLLWFLDGICFYEKKADKNNFSPMHLRDTSALSIGTRAPHLSYDLQVWRHKANKLTRSHRDHGN